MIRKPMAFTLIELLVVISIIALLIALLLPALGRARKSVEQVQCGTQLHEMLTAHVNYAGDHDGQFAPTTPSDPVGRRGGIWSVWTSQVRSIGIEPRRSA